MTQIDEELDLETLYTLELDCEGTHFDKSAHDDGSAQWRIVAGCEKRCSWLVCEGFRLYWNEEADRVAAEDRYGLCPRCRELMPPHSALFLPLSSLG